MEEWVSLELKLISCTDLKAFNFFRKLSAYAVVSITNDELKKNEQQQFVQRQKTPVDGGGGNHEWNHVMRFALPDKGDDHLFLKFKLQCGGVFFGKRCIGEVRVPLKDLIGESTGGASTTRRFVSYQVRTSDGKPNGVLNFSYKMNIKGEPNHEKMGEEETTETSLEIDAKSSLYPSLLDDHIRSPKTPATGPSPQSYYNCYYGMPPPQPLPILQTPASSAVDPGLYFHSCPSPSLRTPVPHWYTEGLGLRSPWLGNELGTLAYRSQDGH